MTDRNTEDGFFEKQDEGYDVSDEQYREYIYPDKSILLVQDPVRLFIEKGKPGGDRHRVKTQSYSYYVTPGWLAIRWKVKTGHPDFAF